MINSFKLDESIHNNLDLGLGFGLTSFFTIADGLPP